MDLNDLPIIVRSDPVDFIYHFLSRQLQPMLWAAAVLLNTFSELEPDCLHALVANFPVRTYAIGPLLPPSATAVNGISPRSDGPAIGALLNNDKPVIVQDKPPLCTTVTATKNHVPARSSTALKAKEKASFTAAKKAATFSIFSEDVSCLQWLDIN
ncbi:hypothetical protein GOP47_0019402 [Adiantum capillus-veneris]|uniref:Uncharacterized protein n=1 Tax=Adiantum capillus-veneris TaxID=13818 RepID=A0A9D4UBR8_ADICA|nr:hypothetical protein GOP47_0019402 [Adiantum capillus-veneris]